MLINPVNQEADAPDVIVKKEVSAFGQQVDVEHFVRVATDLQTALDQRKPSTLTTSTKVPKFCLSYSRSIKPRDLEKDGNIGRSAME